MLRWLRSLFSWRLVRDTGVWAYFENDITGKRKAHKVSRNGQPLDIRWLGIGGVVYGGRAGREVIDWVPPPMEGRPPPPRF